MPPRDEADALALVAERLAGAGIDEGDKAAVLALVLGVGRLGGGGGFLLFETDDLRELTAFLQPYMDLVSFDVHAVYELPYEATIAALRQEEQAADLYDAAVDSMVPI